MSVVEYDIAIVGAGMVGATLAHAVSQIKREDGRQLSIALIDANPPTTCNHPGFDARVIALSYGSQKILTQFNLWDKIAPTATAIKHIHVSDRGHWGITRIDHSEYNLPALGQVIELQTAGHIFQQDLAEIKNINWYCPNQLVGLDRQVGHTDLTLDDGQKIRCKLLVGADGNNSMVRQLTNVPVEVTDFEQTAIIANVSLSKPHEGKAYERFTDTGPLALLPMTEQRSSLVWSVRSDEVDAIMALSDDAFLLCLQQRFGYRLGKFTKTGQRFSYPLLLTEALEPTQHRSIVVGNAAHALHPIAGQGYNLGLRDVAVLHHQIEQAFLADQDVGDQAVTKGYWHKRQGDHQKTIWMTTSLATLFANNYGPLVAGRNLALHTMGYKPEYKRALARQALGAFKLF
ncbi:2-octaprenyl-6-methoxyphenyl hydroxylase [Moritella viscosa]|uniref:2-octaprenyl-6-methoxyphenyl hydroxylase n=1 Tax=Moritella viscosa TaxID=80854 RepID=UPI000508FB9B|nr:2-octaprenyl-6-methoxyphenyl hydroxylase [Moritella viscosa]CED58874.1 2-polyprenyl-6-methoxyphenol hydroxylase [Moritella viscosa]SHN98248.1 2-octaprenyl-6-methoxyphenyl hydroxylase [Moritella viscosa]SHO19841.1 2-octaprenyl-6-methoxyphenyl hydroxylase [Moritella viscosa]